MGPWQVSERPACRDGVRDTVKLLQGCLEETPGTVALESKLIEQAAEATALGSFGRRSLSNQLTPRQVHDTTLSSAGVGISDSVDDHTVRAAASGSGRFCGRRPTVRAVPVPDPVPAPADCRVVTYNVLYEGANPPGHGWERRRPAVVAELERLSPDVLALQEVWLSQLPALRAALPAFSWVATDGDQQHTPIAYRDDAFDLLDSGQFWLVPPETGPGRPGWDATYQRLVTHATLQPTDGPTVTVLSLHLDHEGARARREGVALVRDRLDDLPGEEAVVAGDFNCRPGSPAHERATADRDGWRSLRDAATMADTRTGPTETYTGFTAGDDPKNIDHVLVTDGLDVERVVTCVPPGAEDRPPSDHRPVLVTLRY